jgi:site-specific DNA-methyltransferase (adenine-specific)
LWKRVLRDGIEITGKDGQSKLRHKWEQDISWAEYYIKKLTKENDIVLDPFVGSGTVAKACKNLGRNFIGIDISEEYCNIARQRLNE